jgi:hypothetical protein
MMTPDPRVSRRALDRRGRRTSGTERSALLLVLLAGGVAGAQACSATDDPNTFETSSDDSASSTTGIGGASSASTSTGDGGSLLTTSSGGGMGGEGGTIVNPCGSACGPTELCDDAHVGLDDDCDNQVDEDCDCIGGQAHACFKGDPSYHNAPGCYDGTMKCTENGKWGPCVGGVHVPDNCYANDTTLCHPISAVPFEDVDLKSGTGMFSLGAVTETWTVACPAGINPCPGVSGMSPADDFKPLQSGQYDVTYTKVDGNGATDSCQYPLFVGAPGLRIELSWEHTPADSGVDLDLHVHQPSNTQPWSIFGEAQDCTWSNCTLDDFAPPQLFSSPDWFSDVGMPPTPLNWYEDPVAAKNTCYYSPRGVGQQWQALGMGCHNPRLDLDNITCDVSVLDSDSYDFCAPENVNIDYPPQNEWTRIGVHYFSNHGAGYDVHPNIKIYCDGALAADLGPTGYYSPETPVAFSSADGGQFAGGGNRFWLVADVAFKTDVCDTSSCIVQPIYANPATKTPLLTTDVAAETSFDPPYPPPP